MKQIGISELSKNAKGAAVRLDDELVIRVVNKSAVAGILLHSSAEEDRGLMNAIEEYKSRNK